MMPVVSVIITTYKRPVETVERAVSSVLNQTFQKLEILIVDDNPDEWKLHYGLKKLENKYTKNRVRYITYPGNHGACYARNAGLSEAKGEYVAFLDDDDVWLCLSEKFRIEYVNEEPGIYHVHSGEQITKNPDRKIAGLERLNAKNWNYLNQNSNKSAKWFRTIKIAPFYAMKGQWKNAIAIWWDSVKGRCAYAC